MTMQFQMYIILHILIAVAAGILVIRYPGGDPIRLERGDPGLEEEDVLISHLVAVIESKLPSEIQQRHFKILTVHGDDLYRAASGDYMSYDPFLLQLGGEDEQILEIAMTGYHIPQHYAHKLNDGQHIYLNPTNMKIEFEFDFDLGEETFIILRVSKTFLLSIKKTSRDQWLYISLDGCLPDPAGRGNEFDLSHVQSTEVSFYVEISLDVNGDVLVKLEVSDRTNSTVVFAETQTNAGLAAPLCKPQTITANELVGDYSKQLRKGDYVYSTETGSSRIPNEEFRISTDTADIDQALLFHNYLAEVLWNGALSVDGTNWLTIADVEVMDDGKLKLVPAEGTDLSLEEFRLTARYYRLSDDGRKHTIGIRRAWQSEYRQITRAYGQYFRVSRYDVLLVSQYVHRDGERLTALSSRKRKETLLFDIVPSRCNKPFILFD